MATPCLRRADKVRSAFHSIRKPMLAFNRITTRMALASTLSPITKATTVAAISRSTIRLLN